MEKLKIAFSFIKIKLNKIGNILLKAATGYAVGSFALIQVASIVSDNISITEVTGLSNESFMQYLFIALLILFPIFLINRSCHHLIIILIKLMTIDLRLL